MVVVLLLAGLSLCGQELLAVKVPRTRWRPVRALEGELPPAVDNSVARYFPPVFSQSGGSCAQASGIGYMFTYEMNRFLDRDASLPENQLSYEFVWHMINDGIDQGGFVDEGLLLAYNYGIMTVADYGASGVAAFKWATGYDKYLNAIRYRAAEILTYDDSITVMKRYLYDAGEGRVPGGLLTFSGESTNWQFDNSYEGPSLTGYHSLLMSLATDGAHAMTIVGYDDTVSYTDKSGIVHEGAFIVVNSWGSYMHDRGHFYLPYDFFRDPTVSTHQLSDKVQGVRVRVHEPKVVVKAVIDYSSRNDLRFMIGASTDENARNPQRQKPVSAFQNQGGDMPMRGQYFGSEIEIAIDLTPLLDGLEGDAAVWYVDIIKSVAGKVQGQGCLMALSVMDYRGAVPVEYPYRGPLPAIIEGGNNRFEVRMRSRATVPVSGLTVNSVGDGTLVIRTADGRPAKVGFENNNGRMDLRYQVRKR